MALDNYGQPIAESGVQNPKQLVLPPNGQISQTVSEIFNFDPSKEHIGWLSVSSDQPQVAGYLAIGEIQPTWFGFFLNRLDGVPLFRERLYDWVVPEVVTPSGGSIELNFVNPNYNQGTYDVARYSTDGSLLETRNTNTAYPTNRQTQIFADVFGQPNQGRVVLAGGQGSSATLSTVESFDPKGGTFTATGSMSEARTAHTRKESQSLRDAHTTTNGWKGTVVTRAHVFRHAKSCVTETQDETIIGWRAIYI